jgi:hypothetical protein
MLDACARLGLDTSQILRAAGLDRATLENPDARIPVEQADALWRKAYELSGDANLALHAIEVLPFDANRVIDFLASSAPTIGTALARPSITSLVGPSELWAGNASIDVSVGRTFGAFSPYVGVATSGSVAVERTDEVDLDRAWASGNVAYAGVSYGWRSLQITAEVEKGALVSYGFRIGKRF